MSKQQLCPFLYFTFLVSSDSLDLLVVSYSGKCVTLHPVLNQLSNLIGSIYCMINKLLSNPEADYKLRKKSSEIYYIIYRVDPKF